MYIREPVKIESNSMDIIDQYLADVSFKEEELPVVKRMIHTTGDVDYRHIIEFQGDFMAKALASIQGQTIYTDTNMIRAGVNKQALEKASCSLLTLVADQEVYKEAEVRGITRSIVALEKAVEVGVRIFVIGNAPTALFRLIELVEEGRVEPDFVVGVPVGFVGAAESKEALRQVDLPAVTTVGNKGGSNVAASVINALLYQVVGR